MEDNSPIIEPLFERATDFGKTSLELIKLKTIDKASDAFSTLIPNYFVLILSAFFVLFISLGLAFWIGEVLGQVYLGFIITGLFYALCALSFRLFFNKRIKKYFYEYLVNQMLKES